MDISEISVHFRRKPYFVININYIFIYFFLNTCTHVLCMPDIRRNGEWHKSSLFVAIGLAKQKRTRSWWGTLPKRGGTATIDLSLRYRYAMSECAKNIYVYRYTLAYPRYPNNFQDRSHRLVSCAIDWILYLFICSTAEADVSSRNRIG